ncbi:hypothetical protein ACH5RR_012478 [Cinchona calisaya]|uniref:Uncharacterized protein n=1 Tax=Cinchona calisaya TaxID=153742 RepID=A0ABD3ABG3_9GENT
MTESSLGKEVEKRASSSAIPTQATETIPTAVQTSRNKPKSESYSNLPLSCSLVMPFEEECQVFSRLGKVCLSSKETIRLAGRNGGHRDRPDKMAEQQE